MRIQALVLRLDGIDKFISSSHIAVFQHIINAETCEIAK